MKVSIEVDGQRVDITFDDDGTATVADTTYRIRSHREKAASAVTVGDRAYNVAFLDARTAEVDGAPVPFTILALEGVEGLPDAGAGALGPMRPPMTGRIDAIAVKAGDTVTKGDVLFVLEAMKMQNEVKSPADAIVKSVTAAVGDTVDTGSVILELGPLDG